MTDKKLQKRRENRLVEIDGDTYKDIRRQRRKVLEEAIEAQTDASGDKSEEETELTEGSDANGDAGGGENRENITIENGGMTNAQLTAILKGCGADISDAKNKTELLEAWEKIGDITVSMVSNEGLAEFIKTHDIDLPDDADREAILEYFAD